MNTYTPDSNRVIHHVNVDFVTRSFIDIVHLVQYDNKLPILAVHMFRDGVNYNVSSASAIDLRYEKKDRNWVLLPSVGVSSDGFIAYFEIPYQITVDAGEHHAPIQITRSGSVIGSSSFVTFMVDKNNIDDGQIESLTEYKGLVQYRDEALEYKNNARSYMNTTQGYMNTTKTYRDFLATYINQGLKYKFVSALPTSNIDKFTIYLKLKSGTTDQYENWWYDQNNTWQMVGVTKIDYEVLVADVFEDVKEDMSDYITERYKFKTYILTLTSSGWNSSNEQTISVPYITPTSTVYIAPTYGYEEPYASCNVKGIRQGSGTITLWCIIKPTKNIQISILVVN